VRESAEAIYLPELQTLAAASASKFKVISYYTSEQGFLTADKAEKMSGPLNNHQLIHICGPVLMMKSLKEQFITKGVMVSEIKTEEFSL
ncbi:MAG: hypothetical protein WCO03_02455, partial [bacterium]